MKINKRNRRNIAVIRVRLYRSSERGAVLHRKGCGNRLFSHLEDQSDSEKVDRIAQISSGVFLSSVVILHSPCIFKRAVL